MIGKIAESLVLGQLVKFFIVFFVVVEPLSIVPIFSSLTAGATDDYRRRMAVKAAGISACILLIFALEMVFARESGTRTSTDEQAESRKRADISVFPLAFPLIAGPGALVTILLWVAPVSIAQRPLLFAGLALCAALVLAITLGLMLVSGPLMRMLGVTGANVANRLLGVVLGALSVQFVLDGLRSSL